MHKGMVSAIVYASSAKLLFSGSIDGNIGVWTDKGFLLQVDPFNIIWLLIISGACNRVIQQTAYSLL